MKAWAFRPNTVIIYSTNEEYIGWETPEDHVIYDFMTSNDDELMEDIRKDTESGDFFKYGYLRIPEGGFIQVGISANEVEELQNQFEIQNTLDVLAEDEQIVYSRFITTDKEIAAHTNEDRIETELDDEGIIEAVVNQEVLVDDSYYEEENVDVYNVTVPVEIDDEYIGALNIGYSLEEVQNAVQENLIRIATIGLIFFSLLGGIIYYISSSVVKSISVIASNIERFSNYDFTYIHSDEDIKTYNRKDELGNLTKALGRMRERIVNLLQDINEKSQQVSNSSQELSATSEESTQSANEVSKAIEEIANGATNQAQDTEKGVTEINELGEYIRKNQQKVSNLNTSANEVDTLKNEGMTIVEDLVDKTKSLNNKTTEVNDIIFNTQKSAEQITTASEMIKNVSEQTNLLALNAAIEAARAGKAGQGFSVVADEIRKLAKESNKFTDEIDTIIKDLQEKSSYAVSTMEEVKEIVNSEAKSVEETSNKYEGMKDSIEKMKEVLEDVNDSGDEMEEKENRIINVMENLSSVAEENASETEEASASVEEQTAAMEDIAKASDSLAKLSEEMKNTIDNFKYDL
ncbi:methyl-accepting chemotaxis protein [Natranaerobius trueperi]|uniref:Chemotaxis protein n=1 Tax=Natranaerobius trueperi TaxID=759412 RepID=A0A226C1C9_9FIRM|nr:methyl-accepting chemotaxis protein [Natranaerobius trueperi]OWZ85026.1 chemotaxis protein [Natranaerobius trueperi]